MNKYAIIGDIHGCFNQFLNMLRHPEVKDRPVILVGDLVDRGPDSISVLELVNDAYIFQPSLPNRVTSVCGNHDDKFMRYLKGNPVKIRHGLQKTVDQLEQQLEKFEGYCTAVGLDYETVKEAYKEEIHDLIAKLPYFLSLDDGRLLVTHGAPPPRHVEDRHDKKARTSCLYGRPTGETDEQGFPIRAKWWETYQGPPHVVFGHYGEVIESEWATCVDSSVYETGILTAMLWPEKELIQVS